MTSSHQLIRITNITTQAIDDMVDGSPITNPTELTSSSVNFHCIDANLICST